LTLEQAVALAYASEAMGREVDRLRAGGMQDAADLWTAERIVVDELRHGIEVP